MYAQPAVKLLMLPPRERLLHCVNLQDYRGGIIEERLCMLKSWEHFTQHLCFLPWQALKHSHRRSGSAQCHVPTLLLS